MEALAVLRMLDANAHYHLKPIAMGGQVSRLWIVRPVSPAGFRPIEKTVYREAKGSTAISRLWKVYRESLTIARRPEVGVIVSFNAVPYGLIALLVGWQTRKPVHLGFIGDDWYRYCCGWAEPVLNFLFRRAWLITVTGESMRREMVRKGYDPDKIAHLPHAVDVERFEAKPSVQRRTTCVFVGNLIRRKRVDRIISAMKLVCGQHPDATLCVVGDGPCRKPLERQVAKLGLERNIFFAGWQQEPAPWLSDARIVVMASHREGFPFALVEGMCAGAVPITTDVGTIRDFIEDGWTGLIVPPGDAVALSRSILRLLEDPLLYDRLRERVLDGRDRFRLERTAGLWSQWLRQAAKGLVRDKKEDFCEQSHA